MFLFMILIVIELVVLAIWILLMLYILWRAWNGLFGKEEELENDRKRNVK